MPSKAILLYNGNFLKRVDSAMKTFCLDEKVDTCMRRVLLSDFDDNPHCPSPPHLCCKNCHNRCKCAGEDACHQERLNITVEESAESRDTCGRERAVSSDEKALLTELLKEYQGELAGTCSNYYLSSQCTTGFSDALIQKVIEHARYIYDKEYIEEHLPVFNYHHSSAILNIIGEVFDDDNLVERGTHSLPDYDDEAGDGNDFPSYFYSNESGEESIEGSNNSTSDSDNKVEHNCHINKH